ncbi:non-ribosomal peptide synthetase [Oceanobacillus alkalisoli]|uniref:non-ribosomal peptide synthetase n=1 Tax=Oceanobacillus alkalisoli TaxID=2925113 RepID=UPI001EE3C75D|nr:non-ribosomal peptide synthetase [Oceanobacillus alkalisoli]MCG5104726.1 amino acid adenylation domain-containing protein [Oceanobacillus alkalisoli]
MSTTQIKDICPLSPMQEGMLFHYLNDEKSQLYHEHFIIDINGEFDQAIFQDSFQQLLKEHEILRAVFTYRNSKQPLQVILNDREMNIDFHDLTYLPKVEQEQLVEELIQKEKNQSFNLEKDLLIRASVYGLSQKKYKILLSFHHIIMDGWSFSLLLKDLLDKYESLLHGHSLPVGTIHSYVQYIDWLTGQNKEQWLRYWDEYLYKYDGQAMLPVDYPSTGKRNLIDYTFHLSSDFSEQLENYAKENRVTLNSVLQTMWALLLQRYNDSDDVVFGSVVSGRPPAVPGIEEMVGLFINTIPVRVSSRNVTTIDELVRNVQSNNLNGKEYEYGSLADIQNLTEQKENLIHSILVLENYPISDEMDRLNDQNDLGFIIENIQVEEATNYDLNIIVNPGIEMKFTIKYNADVYSESLIKQLGEQMHLLLAHFSTERDIALHDISIITEAEKKILESMNETKTSYHEESIIDVFEKITAVNPDKLALVLGKENYTYKNLVERINKIYSLLQQNGAKAGDVIALNMDKSMEMIATMLAVIKLGAIYVPINVKDNQERMNYILEDSRTQLLLTNRSEVLRKDASVAIVDVNDAWSLEVTVEEQTREVHLEDPAYIMYTSGSTGNPKGVLIKQKSILRVVSNTNYIDITGEDVLLQLSDYSFDGAVFDIYGALLNGATLCLINTDDFLDFGTLTNIIKKNNVTVSFMTTALFNTVVDNKIDALAGFRKILFGGERASVNHIQKALDYLGKDKLIHVYGPTESTVFTTFYPINDLTNQQAVPIGKPITNTQVFLLDRQQLPVPLGGVGELYISGEGLAAGYLNKEELTKEAFVIIPELSSERLYRTGDLVTMDRKGNIIFLDRVDHQVKLRGFRIELGEIEEKIVHRLDAKEAIVLPERDENGNVQRLVAYVVGSKEIKRQQLIGLLPYYMVPEQIVMLEKLPLNKNGKIDKSRLPQARDIQTAEVDHSVSELEKEMIDLWKEVLGLQQINVYDHFFEIGGHSLKATSLISKIRKKWDVQLGIKDIYNHPILEEMVGMIQSLDKQLFMSIPKSEEKAYYDLSFAEQRMYTMWNMDRDSTVYNISSAFTLKGDINKQRIQSVLQKLVEGHEALRTTFHLVDDIPKKQIHEQMEVPLQERSIMYHSVDEEIVQIIQPYDLEEGPLFRAYLFEKEQNEHILVFDLHHIIADGTSIGILIRQFSKLYNGEALEWHPLQYKDYSEWQLQQSESEVHKTDRQYWLDRFSDDIPKLDFPLDASRTNKHSYSGKAITKRLDHTLLQDLKGYAKESNVSLYSVLLASYYVLLEKYTGEENIVVGTSVEGRDHEDLTEMVGMFVNTLALKNNVNGNQVFHDFLKGVHQNFLQDYERSHYQFDELVSELNIPRESGRNPLFDVMFVMQNSDIGTIQMDGLIIEDYLIEQPIEKFDMTLQSAEEDGELLLSLSYSDELFSDEQMQLLLENYVNLLSHLLEYKYVKLANISVLTKNEIDFIYDDFNDTNRTYEKENSIIQVFNNIVKQSPHKVAIQHDDKEITYEELDRQSNQMANYLQEAGVMKQDVVGLTADRSADAIISILAIVKCGATYLPLDMDNPVSRLATIVEDANPSLIINLSGADLFEWSNTKGIPLPDWQRYNKVFKQRQEVNGDSPLYISYTSGSTGKPKGVVIKHKSAARLVLNSNIVQWKREDKLLLTGSLAFDSHTFEIWGSLLNGITLCIEKKDIILNSESLKHYLKDNQVTVMWLTASLFHQLCQEDPEIFRPLSYLLTGGDVVSPKFVNRAREYAPSLTIINGYGPTENTTFSLTYPIKKTLKEDVSVPLGKPISNSTAYILDKHGELAPIGAWGEIYVGGDGLASHYLNEPEMTREKFVHLKHITNQKLYQTGDMGRLKVDGNIEFTGRTDDQVKIRGYRIEVGEIEKTLLKNIKEIENIAIIFDKEEKQLIAYYILNEKQSGNIRELARPYLTEYMMPRYFIEMAQFPLNINGKLDKRQLPKPVLHENTEPATFENEKEEVIAVIWSEVLGQKIDSREANFFEVGGDSIKGIQMIGKLRKVGIKIEISDLIKYPTIAEISCFTKDVDIISQKEITGPVPMTPIQRQYTSLNEDFHHFNQSVFLFNKEGIDETATEKALRAIIEHHDALRITYKGQQSNELMIQPVDNNYNFEVVQTNSEEEINVITERTQQSMNLATGPLVRAVLFQMDEGDHLLIVIHHLVVDGVSWRIILEDFYTAYHQVIEGRSQIILEEKTHSVKAWVDHLQKHRNSEELQNEYAYWEKIAEEETVQIPLRNVRERKWKSRRVNSKELTEDQTETLLYLAPKVFDARMNDLLLAALRLAVQEVFSLEGTIPVLLEGHGRNADLFNLDLSRTVGWFTISYPINLPLQAGETLTETIFNTKEIIDQVPNGGIGWGLLSNSQDEFTNDEQPQISFNYLGQIDSDVEHGEFGHSSYSGGSEVGEEILSLSSLDINALVINHKLRINFGADKLEIDDKLLETIGNTYVEKLVELTNQAKQANEYQTIGKQKIEAVYNQPSVVLLNEKKEQHVFVFPPHMPQIGYSILYKNLSLYLETHSFYMFNFVANEDILNYYADQVIALQKEGPYTLLGYSFGGTIAMEVARILEARGYQVDDIILIDSYVVEEDSFNHISMEAIESSVDAEVTGDFSIYMSLDEEMRKDIVNSFINYYQYTKDIVNLPSPLDSNLHLLKVEGKVGHLKDTRGKWEELTVRGYYEYPSVGEHEDMLTGEFLSKNASIVSSILKDIIAHRNR